MITTTTIKALAYPVKLKDHRTGELLEDTVVLEKSWLQICGKLDIDDDKRLIYRIYNRKGFEVLEVGKRRKVQLTVDLEQLYRDHVAHTAAEGLQRMLGTAGIGEVANVEA